MEIMDTKWTTNFHISNPTDITIQLSVGWGGCIEPPFQVDLWCSCGANTMETMDFMSQVDNVT